MTRNPELNRFRRLFEVCDLGLFDSPPEWATLRRAYDALLAAPLPQRNSNEAEVSRELVDAAIAGEVPAAWDVAFDLQSYESALEHSNAVGRSRDMALATLSDRLVSSVYAYADDLLVEGLRPALAKVVEAVRPHLGVIDVLPFGVRHKSVTPELRDALVAVEDATALYVALRTAQSVLRDVRGTPDAEAHRYYGEVRDGMRTYWPGLGTFTEGQPPFPTDPPERLAWFVENASDALWVPTPDECEAAARADWKQLAVGGVFPR